MKNEYMDRMKVLAEEINSGKMHSNMCIGIVLNPPAVDWSDRMNFTDADEYDGLFFVESLLSDEPWDSVLLAEHLETLTREFVSENQGEE